MICDLQTTAVKSYQSAWKDFILKRVWRQSADDFQDRHSVITGDRQNIIISVTICPT